MAEKQKKPDTGAAILTKNSELTLEITDLNNLGCGVGRAPDGRVGRAPDGRVVFVAGAVAGDVVRTQIIKVNHSYAVGKLLAVLTPSPDRYEGFCAAPLSCGGCVYRHLSYERELVLKREYVKHCFSKAGLGDVVVENTQTTGEVTGYRNKAEYPITVCKNALTGGFYAPKTHRVVAAQGCALQPPIFGEILHTVCKLLTAQGVSAYDETTGKGLLRHVYLRHGKSTGEIMVCPVVNGKALPDEAAFVAALRAAFPQITSILLNCNTRSTNVVLGDRYRTLWGKECLSDVLCGKRFDIAPGAFYQVNHTVAQELCRTVARYADLQPGEVAADLYCGTGTIGLTLAALSPQATVMGIEIVESAVRDAVANAERNHLGNIRFRCGDSATAEAEGMRFDCIVIDPPRKGCSPEMIQALVRLHPRRIVYVSCNPATLARDAALLADAGWRITQAQPFDMFPRTGHCECVVKMERG